MRRAVYRPTAVPRSSSEFLGFLGMLPSEELRGTEEPEELFSYGNPRVLRRMLGACRVDGCAIGMVFSIGFATSRPAMPRIT